MDKPARRVYLGFGSNLGDREASILGALIRLRRAGLLFRSISSLYETSYLGPEPAGQGPFLNCVAVVETHLEPMELLRLTQAIELAGGRQPERRSGPRTIDVDILLIEGVTMDTADLTLPHPRMWERAFVLAPLAELVPELRCPDGRTVLETANELIRAGQNVHRLRAAKF